MKCIIAAVACSLQLASASAAELTIHIDDVKSADGTVKVAVYDSAANFLKKVVQASAAQAAPGTVTITLKDLPEGELAFAVYHDANGNGKMDRNPVGMPTEDFAFSNNAMGVMGPPPFEQARLVLPASGLAARVSLR